MKERRFTQDICQQAWKLVDNMRAFTISDVPEQSVLWLKENVIPNEHDSVRKCAVLLSQHMFKKKTA